MKLDLERPAITRDDTWSRGKRWGVSWFLPSSCSAVAPLAGARGEGSLGSATLCTPSSGSKMPKDQPRMTRYLLSISQIQRCAGYPWNMQWNQTVRSLWPNGGLELPTKSEWKVINARRDCRLSAAGIQKREEFTSH